MYKIIKGNVHVHVLIHACVWWYWHSNVRKLNVLPAWPLLLQKQKVRPRRCTLCIFSHVKVTLILNSVYHWYCILAVRYSSPPLSIVYTIGNSVQKYLHVLPSLLYTRLFEWVVTWRWNCPRLTVIKRSLLWLVLSANVTSSIQHLPFLKSPFHIPPSPWRRMPTTRLPTLKHRELSISMYCDLEWI